MAGEWVATVGQPTEGCEGVLLGRAEEGAATTAVRSQHRGTIASHSFRHLLHQGTNFNFLNFNFNFEHTSSVSVD